LESILILGFLFFHHGVLELLHLLVPSPDTCAGGDANLREIAFQGKSLLSRVLHGRDVLFVDGEFADAIKDVLLYGLILVPEELQVLVEGLQSDLRVDGRRVLRDLLQEALSVIL
jgi:hypothetical protein